MLSLGVDVGTTNVKVALVEIRDENGEPAARELVVATAPTPASGTDMVGEVLRLVAEVAETSDGRRPDCVGVASMAETGVPLDHDDHPLGDMIRWDGHRGQTDAAQLSATYGAAALFAATGVRPSGKAPLAVWAQLRRTDSRRWSSMRRWAGAADLVALALTGRLVTDHTLAGRSMAYRLAEPGTGPADGFDTDLLAAVGLRSEQLPEVRLAAASAVPSRPGIAGLRPGTPVVVAGHDHQVGAWAAGVRQPADVADSIGTAEAVLTVLERPPDPEAVREAGMSLVRTVGGASEALVAGSSSAGSMLRWWIDQVLRDPEIKPSKVDALLGAAADRRGPARAFVLPYLHGRQSPSPDAAATARLIPASAGDDQVDLAAALLDGLNLQARWVLTVQSALAGYRLRDQLVRVLGSAARDGSPWLRTKAAVGPARLQVVLSAEPVAAGAALLAAQRCGMADAELRLPDRLVADKPLTAYDDVYSDFVEAAEQRSA
ncbi:MAG: hypothetical protein L0H24_09655 [Microlunatus sp.]|nr:hypothetical protein [Microlunatus sp.]